VGREGDIVIAARLTLYACLLVSLLLSAAAAARLEQHQAEARAKAGAHPNCIARLLPGGRMPCPIV
jgi:hypothetical protein